MSEKNLWDEQAVELLREIRSLARDALHYTYLANKYAEVGRLYMALLADDLVDDAETWEAWKGDSVYHPSLYELCHEMAAAIRVAAYTEDEVTDALCAIEEAT